VLSLPLELALRLCPCGHAATNCARNAIQYRDGLIIALTAFIPLRCGNLAALDLGKHLDFEEDAIAGTDPDT
jgi:hypothetical protein